MTRCHRREAASSHPSLTETGHTLAAKMPFLGTRPKEIIQNVNKDLCIKMVTAVLFLNFKTYVLNVQQQRMDSIRFPSIGYQQEVKKYPQKCLQKNRRFKVYSKEKQSVPDVRVLWPEPPPPPPALKESLVTCCHFTRPPEARTSFNTVDPTARVACH